MIAADRIRLLGLVAQARRWFVIGSIVVSGLSAVALGVYLMGRRDGANRVRLAQADSTLTWVTPRLATLDRIVVHDTVRVRSLLTKYDTLRDTVRERISDTVFVKEFVRVADSVARACNGLSRDCAAFRLLANTKIAALEHKVALLPHARSCRAPSLVASAFGVVGGYLLFHR